jgi:dihydroorotase
MTETPRPYDLLLAGGQVIDPANGIDARLDVAIQDGKIAQVAAGIPTGAATRIIDVSGLIVTPGILDIHTHVYPFKPSSKSYVESMHADAHLLASGVTTTVDAGTAGWEHFLDFKEGTIDRMKVRILAFLNIARSGMVDASSEQNPAHMQPHIAASLVQDYPDLLVGIKTAHYWTRDPWDEIHTPWASVDKALEAAELCGKPVMVDFWPRPPERPYPNLILKKLRSGDFHTHVFAQQFPVLDDSARVSDFMFEARQRGVLFDLGHGAGSFWFRNAVPAVQDGFPPDTISTDLHMGNINGPVASMQQTMSKLLNMGLPLSDVIQRSTSVPARLIGHPELGSLSPGAEADVAVFQLLEGSFTFADCGRARMAGMYRLECRLTLRAGQILYDPSGLSMPDWQVAPPAYWQIQA